MNFLEASLEDVCKEELKQAEVTPHIHLYLVWIETTDLFQLNFLKVWFNNSTFNFTLLNSKILYCHCVKTMKQQSSIGQSKSPENSECEMFFQLYIIAITI